ncbi:helix-turn-helix transcriptional regulator [Endozoicomonas sp. ONNA2]|uniref:helix-turn-helix transcriptional regulator n=1 Tax=Endozoicomonas sp. ONNA2 TaxID=2828741 RepID=UPI0021486CCB|nr:helix-turn-helix transcriptional regulator [Endozoicomonas sp. ONNA2]
MSSNLIKLALKELDITQKEMAMKLGVSPAQITKWKAGEHMSHDMTEKIKGILKLDELDPDVVFWTGGIKEANKWQTLVHYLAEMADENAECNYNTQPFDDDTGLLLFCILRTLTEAGVEIPKIFPEDIEFDYSMDYEGNEKLFDSLISVNPYSNLIYELLIAWAQLYDFYAAFVSDLTYDDEIELFEDCHELEFCLPSLALAKIGGENDLLKDYRGFRYKTEKYSKELINKIKKQAVKAGYPLRAELYHLITRDPESLVHEAEAEAFGFNDDRIHPDVYMNEILTSLRLMHQVLPAICDKLGVEFTVDSSELSAM